MNFKIFSLLLICIIGTIDAKKGSPVLSYFKNSEEKTTVKEDDIGSTITSDKFLSQVKPLLEADKEQVTVILVNELKVQDLIPLFKDETIIVDKSKLTFDRAVQDPFKTLENYLKSQERDLNILYADNSEDGKEKFIANIKNSEYLILTEISTEDDSELIQRDRRQANYDEEEETTASNSSISVFGDNCAAIFQSISIVNETAIAKNRERQLVIDESSLVFSCENSTANLTMKFLNITEGEESITELSMNFYMSNQYWMLSDGEVKTIDGQMNETNYGLVYMGTPYSMATPRGFSYVCTKSYFKLQTNTSNELRMTRVSLFVNYLQFQPFGVNTTMTNGTAFGKINYCQGFFSSGIWMGITSSLLLVFILVSGICSLNSIKTMDRFDDPKGKPLTIALEK